MRPDATTARAPNPPMKFQGTDTYVATPDLMLAALTPAAHAQDAEAGRAKAAMCIGCHGIPGYQNAFPEVHKVPMISGQAGGYLAAALQAYRSGERRHPTMRGIARALSDADIADLAAFYERDGAAGLQLKSVAARQPSARVTELLTQGACASCHGENLDQPIDPSYPKIAGQHPDYLLVALKAYQVQGGRVVGRDHPIMNGIVGQFTLAELRMLADHIGSLPGSLSTVPQSRWR